MASGNTLLKYGWFGCLGITALIVVSLAVVIGIARMQAGDVEMTEEAIRPDIPPALFEPLKTEQTTSEFGQIAAEGTIELDLAGAMFHVKPAAEGESLHTDAVYDKNIYVFEETLTTSETGPWRYRLTFKKVGTGLFVALNEMFGNEKPKVTIYLPTDRPVALDFRLGKGAAEVELGGLWLTEADINIEMGGTHLLISEPMQAPMARMDIVAPMGGFRVIRLGNASPRVLNVDISTGGMDLDLRGRWVADSDIDIRFAMGGGRVDLPGGVRFEGLAQPGISLQADKEIPPPTLKFDITGKPEYFEIRYP